MPPPDVRVLEGEIEAGDHLPQRHVALAGGAPDPGRVEVVEVGPLGLRCASDDLVELVPFSKHSDRLTFDRDRERLGNLRPFETEIPGLCLGDARAQNLDPIPPVVAHVLGSWIGAEDLLGPAGELTQHDGIGARDPHPDLTGLTRAENELLGDHRGIGQQLAEPFLDARHQISNLLVVRHIDEHLGVSLPRLFGHVGQQESGVAATDIGRHVGHAFNRLHVLLGQTHLLRRGFDSRALGQPDIDHELRTGRRGEEALFDGPETDDSPHEHRDHDRQSHPPHPDRHFEEPTVAPIEGAPIGVLFLAGVRTAHGQERRAEQRRRRHGGEP